METRAGRDNARRAKGAKIRDSVPEPLGKLLIQTSVLGVCVPHIRGSNGRFAPDEGSALKLPEQLFLLTGSQGDFSPGCRFAGCNLPYKSRGGAVQEPLPALLFVASCKFIRCHDFLPLSQICQWLANLGSPGKSTRERQEWPPLAFMSRLSKERGSIEPAGSGLLHKAGRPDAQMRFDGRLIRPDRFGVLIRGDFCPVGVERDCLNQSVESRQTSHSKLARFRGWKPTEPRDLTVPTARSAYHPERRAPAVDFPA